MATGLGEEGSPHPCSRPCSPHEGPRAQRPQPCASIVTKLPMLLGRGVPADHTPGRRGNSDLCVPPHSVLTGKALWGSSRLADFPEAGAPPCSPVQPALWTPSGCVSMNRHCRELKSCPSAPTVSHTGPTPGAHTSAFEGGSSTLHGGPEAWRSGYRTDRCQSPPGSDPGCP